MAGPELRQLRGIHQRPERPQLPLPIARALEGARENREEPPDRRCQLRRLRARPGLSTSRKAWSVNRVVFRDGVVHYGATVEVRRADSPVCEEEPTPAEESP
jgi:hypothetical protein